MTDSGASTRSTTGIRLTERDLQMLEVLGIERYMKTDQFRKLFWVSSRGGEWGGTKASQTRLRKLRTQGFIRAIEQPVKRGQGPKPLIYALDRRGAELLTEEIGIPPEEIDWRPKAQEENYPFMEHLLATTDFRIAILQGCEQTGVIFEEWRGEKELKSAQNVDYVTLQGPHGGQVRAAVVPDAYFMLCHQERRGIFFVEIDLRTVTIAPTVWERRGWLRKIRAYVEYFKSEAYHTRYEGRRARVLTVTFGETRLRNLKKATEHVFQEFRKAGLDTEDENRFWFALYDEKASPAAWLTEPVWLVAGSDTPRALIG